MPRPVIAALPIVAAVPRLPTRHLALSLLFVATASAGACEPPRLRGPGGARLEGARYVIAWRPLVPLRAGELIGLEVTACANDGQPRPSTLRIEASEPGGTRLARRPEVRPQGPARFVVERLQIERPGSWDLVFEVNTGIERETLSTRIVLE